MHYPPSSSPPTNSSGGGGSGNKLGSLGDRLGDLTVALFHWWGRFVGRHPGKILIASLIFTVLCAPGLAFIRINLDLYKLFVPLDAPVRFEFESQKAYDLIPPGELGSPPPSLIAPEQPASSSMNEQLVSEAAQKDLQQEETGKNKRAPRAVATKQKPARDPSAPIHNDILRFYVVHNDYENLLESDILASLYEYTNEMMLVKHIYDGIEWTFEDFCKRATKDPKCDNNLNVWLKHAENLFRSNGSRVNPNLQLSYPIMYLFGRPKDIGNIIYGVNVTGQKHEIVGARVLTIHWFIAFPMVGDMQSAYFAYRNRLNEFWSEKTKLSSIKFIPHNDKAMDDELRLIIETAVPFALPATIQLMIFVYLTNLARDIRKSKPLEAFIGVISVCLSLLATFGLTFYFGLPFNPVSSTMPFLILATGVDDAFMILGSWRMTDQRDSIEKRMAETMADAGASITVTSLTNFGCFALGYFLSPTPAVGDFCILTATGVMMDYVYQVTFFSALLVYGGLREKEGGLVAYVRCSSKEATTPKSTLASCRDCARTDSLPNFKSAEEEQAAIQSLNEPTIMHRFFRDYYAPFILRREVKAISWLIFMLYVCVSFYGCIKMRVDISPKKYIRDNSPIQTFVHLADK